jgi:hypothetical protein
MQPRKDSRPSGSYLSNLAKHLHLAPDAKDDILREMEGHLEERTAEMEQAGLSPPEARRRASQQMGRPGAVAGDLYAIHSRGSWRDILLATLPHLLLAALFALHLWTEILVLMVAMALFTFIAYRGWKNSGAKWTYSWLGYCLAAPTISWIMAFMALGYAGYTLLTRGSLPFGIPLLLALIIYVPISLWILADVIMRLVKRDWLLASFTALPFPFLTSWILFLNWQGFLWSGSSKIQETDIDRVVVFLALAVTTAIFFKVGRRLVQIALLTLSTALMVVYTVVAIPLTFGILAVILLILSSAAFLFSPAILEAVLALRKASSRRVPPGRQVVTHWFTAPS